MHRIVGQPLCAVQINDCVRNLRAHRTVDIAYGIGFTNSLTLPDVPINFGKNLCVQTLFEIMLLGQTMAPFLRTALRPVQHSGKIDALSLPVVNVVSLLQKVTASDQLFKPSNTQLRHDFTHLLGHEKEVVDHM